MHLKSEHKTKPDGESFSEEARKFDGAFYTPLPFVKVAHSYLENIIGPKLVPLTALLPPGSPRRNWMTQVKIC